MGLGSPKTATSDVAAMRAFGVMNFSKPSELQIWMDKLARLAEYEGAQLTAVERALALGR